MFLISDVLLKSRFSFTISVAIAIIVGFGLRVYHLGYQYLWIDEGLSVITARLSPGAIVAEQASRSFSHPPMFHLILAGWIPFVGEKEFAVRFLSLMMGVLLIPLLFKFAERLFDVRIAVVAAWLIAISPFFIYYSQEARMYTQLSVFGTLALYCALRVQEPHDRYISHWIGYIASATGALYTHYYAALVPAVATAFLLRHWHRKKILPWLAAQLVVLALYLPWLAVASGFRASLSAVAATDNSTGPLQTLSEVYHAFSVGVLPVEGWETWPLLELLILPILVSGVLLCAKWEPLPRKLHGGHLVLIWLLLSFIFAATIPSKVNPRYLTVAAPAFYLCLAIALAKLSRNRLLLLTGFIMVLAPWVLALASYYNAPRDAKSAFPAAVTRVDADWQTGDAIVLNGPLAAPLLSYYNTDHKPAYHVPGLFLPPLDPEATRSQLERIQSSHNRLWLLQYDNEAPDPSGFVRGWLLQNTYLAMDMWFPDARLSLFVTGPKVVPASANILVGDFLTLAALKAEDELVQAGGALRFVSEWYARRDFSETFALSLRLIDDRGLIWAQRDWWPEFQKTAGEFTIDNAALLIPVGTPPGEYYLQLVPYQATDGVPLPIGVDSGQSANVIDLGSVTVVRGEARSPLPQLDYLVDISLGPLSLLGHGITPAELKPGATFIVNMLWRIGATPPSDYAVVISLVDRAGYVLAQWEETLGQSGYPASQWSPEEIVQSMHKLDLPGRIPSGNLSLEISLMEGAGGTTVGSTVKLGDVAVKAQRNFAAPQPQHRLQVDLGGQVRLLGFDLSDTAQRGRLHLTLYWQTLAPMDRNYTVFIHLTRNDELRAQKDNQPQYNTYPTSWWQKGEVVADSYEIDTSTETTSGEYALVVGMYDSRNGERLISGEGDDYVILTTVALTQSLDALN